MPQRDMTTNDSAAIAVLQSQMTSMTTVVERIDTKLDALNTLYVTKAEFAEFKQRWFLSHTLAAVFGGLLTGLTTYVITHLIH